MTRYATVSIRSTMMSEANQRGMRKASIILTPGSRTDAIRMEQIKVMTTELA